MLRPCSKASHLAEPLSRPGHCIGRFQSDTGFWPVVSRAKRDSLPWAARRGARSASNSDPDGIHVRHSLFLQPAVVQRKSHNFILAHPPIALAAACCHVHGFGIGSQCQQPATTRAWVLPLLPIVQPRLNIACLYILVYLHLKIWILLLSNDLCRSSGDRGPGVMNHHSARRAPIGFLIRMTAAASGPTNLACPRYGRSAWITRESSTRPISSPKNHPVTPCHPLSPPVTP